MLMKQEFLKILMVRFWISSCLQAWYKAVRGDLGFLDTDGLCRQEMILNRNADYYCILNFDTQNPRLLV